MSGHYPVGNLEPDIRPVGKCLASNPCKETMFDHKEHTWCRGCNRRVPVPLDVQAIMNSVDSCAMCSPKVIEKIVYVERERGPCRCASCSGYNGWFASCQGYTP